jgi:acetyltransferase-like isoleucine patch superfamily enzyme
MLVRTMGPRRALQLFFRRMLCLELSRLCPFAAGRIALYRLMGVRIGRGCYVGFHVELDTNHPELIEIGDGVTISHRCILVTHMATDAATPLRALYPGIAAPVRIADGAWLCVGAIVLPGVTIGRNAVVAAGAVVNRDVPPGTLVAGVPARVVKDLGLRDGSAGPHRGDPSR